MLVAPKPVLFMFVLAPKGFAAPVPALAPKPPVAPPPPKSEPPVVDPPKPVAAGLLCPKSPTKSLATSWIRSWYIECLPPPALSFAPKPVFVFAVFPNPPAPPPNAPVVPVFAPNMPPPVVAVVDAPNVPAGLLAANGLLCWLFVLFAPKPPNPPVVAVFPPKSEPPLVVAALLLLFAPKPPVLFVAPKPPKPVPPALLLPKPKDMLALARGCRRKEGALLRWKYEVCTQCAGSYASSL